MIEFAKVRHTPQGPVCQATGDMYFSLQDGPAETRQHFVVGSQMAQRLAHLPAHGRFTVGEIGFGTGLNLLEAWRLFRDMAPDSATLHWVSFERFPLSPADHRQALAHLSADYQADAQALCDAMPCWPLPGFHALSLFGGRVRLLLWLGEALEGLQALGFGEGGGVDTWWLDGFAPSVNPEAWTDALTACLPGHALAGATVATFSAAGAVRRGLQAAGFEVEKKPGFGQKRECLAGALPGTWQPAAVPMWRAENRPVKVAGAGMAGAAVAAALVARGAQVVVEDPQPPASQASGNPQGLVQPRLSGVGALTGDWARAAWVHADRQLRARGLLEVSGVRHLAGSDKAMRRLMRQVQALAWPEAVVQLEADGVLLPEAGWVRPQALVQAWLGQVEVVRRAWDGQVAADEVRVVATGRWLDQCLPSLFVSRGQLAVLEGSAVRGSGLGDEARMGGGGYWIPDADGTGVLGATRHEGDLEEAVREADRQALLEKLPVLGVSGQVVAERVSFRTHAPDHLPVVGRLDCDQGEVWALGALGARGVTSAALGAQLLVAQMLGEPLPVPVTWAQALAPMRLQGAGESL